MCTHKQSEISSLEFLELLKVVKKRVPIRFELAAIQVSITRFLYTYTDCRYRQNLVREAFWRIFYFVKYLVYQFCGQAKTVGLNRFNCHILLYTDSSIKSVEDIEENVWYPTISSMSRRGQEILVLDKSNKLFNIDGGYIGQLELPNLTAALRFCYSLNQLVIICFGRNKRKSNLSSRMLFKAIDSLLDNCRDFLAITKSIDFRVLLVHGRESSVGYNLLTDLCDQKHRIVLNTMNGLKIWKKQEMGFAFHYWFLWSTPQLEIAQKFNLWSTNCVVTGCPWTSHSMRTKLNGTSPNEGTNGILFVGQPVEEASSLVSLACLVAEMFPESNIVFRPHPRENFAGYGDTFSAFKNINLQTELTKFTLYETFHFCDWVIGLWSTVLLEAFSLEKKIVSYNPQDKKKYLLPYDEDFPYTRTQKDVISQLMSGRPLIEPNNAIIVSEIGLGEKENQLETFKNALEDSGVNWNF